MELPGAIWAMGQFPQPRLLHVSTEAHITLTTNLEAKDCKGKFSMSTPLRGTQPIIKFWIRQPEMSHPASELSGILRRSSSLKRPSEQLCKALLGIRKVLGDSTIREASKVALIQGIRED
jgi:hypothetical protein